MPAAPAGVMVLSRYALAGQDTGRLGGQTSALGATVGTTALKFGASGPGNGLSGLQGEALNSTPLNHTWPANHYDQIRRCRESKAA